MQLVFIFKDNATLSPLTLKKGKKSRASDLLGILNKTNRHRPISIATEKSVRGGVRIRENLQLLAVTPKDSVDTAVWQLRWR